MKRLDRYIVGKFLGTFGFLLALFCMVVLVFDSMECVRRLVEHKVRLGDTALHYLIDFFHSTSFLRGFILVPTIIVSIVL